MAKKSKKKSVSKSLIIICLITGVATFVLRIINRRMQIAELGDVIGLVGTAFTVCLIILIAVWVLNYMSKK